MTEPLFGAADFQAAMSASDSQMRDLAAFRKLLADWNTRMNLVAPNALPDFWLRHAYDSAQLLHVEQHASVWADLGAGAGFPGVVLAILLKDRPGARVFLIESMAKRVNFLRILCETLGLPAQVLHGRAEALPAPPDVEIVTARACAPLGRLLAFAGPCLRAGARALFLKGRGVEGELEQARGAWSFDATLIPSLSDPSGRIVRIDTAVGHV